MKKIFCLLTSSIVFILLCCTNKSDKRDITIKVYRLDKILRKYDYDLILINKNDTKKFYYCDSVYTQDEMVFAELELMKKDSIVKYFNHECIELETETYNICGDKHKVLKLKYDRPNESDEEQVLYFNHDYGLLVTYSWIWYTYSVFESDSTSKLLINEIVNHEIYPDFKKLKEVIPVDSEM